MPENLSATVSQVAKRLSISARRVRQLLEAGRMKGVKNGGRWSVSWPLSITAGKRGPDMKNYPTRLDSSE